MANIIIIDADIMLRDLKLKSNELLIYAIIYGFSKDGQGCFYGSINYLAETINISKNTVQNILKSLVDKKLITKKDIFRNNVKFCEYKVNLEGIQKNGIPSQKLDEGIPKTDMGYTKNCDEGIPKICTNSKLDNIIIKNNENSIVPVEATPQAEPTTTTTQKEVKHKYGEYNHVLLTDKQYNSLVEKYGKTIIDRYITKIDEWIQLKGKSQYKDFNLAIQQWLKKDNVQPMVNSYQNQNNGGWWG